VFFSDDELQKPTCNTGLVAAKRHEAAHSVASYDPSSTRDANDFRRVTAVNLRIVGPRISFWHYLMQSVIPYAPIRVRRDVGTMAEGRLRRTVLCLRFRIDIAVGKGADVLWTGLPLYECSTLARVIDGRARIDPTPSPVGTVCISAAFLGVCARRRV
jgi:hypothetical protein